MRGIPLLIGNRSGGRPKVADICLHTATILSLTKDMLCRYDADMPKLRWDIFENRDLVRLLGISERELRYWAILGILKPELGSAVGRPGIRRRYSFKNVVQAGLVQTLLANHISLHAVPTFLRLVNKAWFFLYKPTQLFLVLHKGNFVRIYVRDL